jgi:TolA-binding protein
MQAECSRAWQIDALRDGKLGLQDAESFERHCRACASCTGRMAANERLGALARALADRAPTELELRRVRARVLRDTAEARTPGTQGSQGKRAGAFSRAAVLALALTAVLLGVWSVATRRRIPTPPVATMSAAAATVARSAAPAASAPAPAADRGFAGLVLPSSDAAWSQTRDGRLERVRLDAGTLIVRVRPQESDERFLVELPDGELEVRGTTFSVTVRDGATTRVRVDEGKVELRLAGLPARALFANEVWPYLSAAAPARTRRAAVPSTRVVAPASHIPLGTALGTDTTRLADDDATRYADAVRLLRAGKYDEAANAFHTFGAGHPRASQAEDASYLEAVALAYAGRMDAAARVAEQYLDGFPESFHRKEAAILVARAARMRGDCGKARAALAPWRDVLPEAEAQSVLRTCF